VLLLGLYVADNFKWRGYFYTGSISRLYAIKKGGAKQISSGKAKVYLTGRDWDTIDGLIQFFGGRKGYLMPLRFDPMVNFLTGLDNPTRFSILHPAFIQDESRQRRVIKEVEKYKVGYVLIHRVFWTGEDGMGQYAPKLYEYVAQHYRLQKEIGDYMIFSRR
jgi:hypothetical protein